MSDDIGKESDFDLAPFTIPAGDYRWAKPLSLAPKRDSPETDPEPERTIWDVSHLIRPDEPDGGRPDA